MKKCSNCRTVISMFKSSSLTKATSMRCLNQPYWQSNFKHYQNKCFDSYQTTDTDTHLFISTLANSSRPHLMTTIESDILKHAYCFTLILTMCSYAHRLVLKMTSLSREWLLMSKIPLILRATSSVDNKTLSQIFLMVAFSKKVIVPKTRVQTARMRKIICAARMYKSR